MDLELLGLDAEVGTALALIASGVIVPAVTSLMAFDGFPKWAKRALPVALSGAAAIVIVVLAAGGPFAEQLITWLLVAATVVGISQTVYTVMPGAWKTLERTTDPGARQVARNVQAAQSDAPEKERRARRDGEGQADGGA